MVEKLLIRLIGDGSSYRAMISNASKQTERFEKSVRSMGKSVTSMGQSVRRMGTALTLAVTVPLVGMGATAVNEFAKFDHAMTQSTSIMKVTAEQTARMRKTALTLSGNAVQSPSELARSYFFLASAGLDAEQSMAALPQVMKFATAGAFDMSLATDLLTDAQSALGLTSKDATENLKGMARVSDVLVKANTLANASVQQFSEALTNTAGATLKNFNKSVEEGVAVLAAYADQGVKAQVAGTNLTRVTLLLQQATLKNSKEHKRLGFRVFDATGKMRNYADIIANLEQITEGLTDEQKAATLAQLGFQARVQNAILPLIGMSQKIREYEGDLRQAGRVTDDVANKQMLSFTNQMKILGNQAKVMALALGEKLAPTVLKINKFLRALLNTFNRLDPATQKIIAGVILMAAAAGPLLIITGTLIVNLGRIWVLLTILASPLLKLVGLFKVVGIALLGFATNPVVLAIAAVAGLVVGVRALAGSWADAAKVTGRAIDFMVDQLIFLVRTGSRIVFSFGVWLAARFDEIWTKDFVGAVVKGLEMAAKKLFEFGKLIGKFLIAKINAIFTGDESEVPTLANFLKMIQGDVARAATNKDFFKVASDIIEEERRNRDRNRAGKAPILTPQAEENLNKIIDIGKAKLEPIQATIVETKDKTANDIKEMAGTLKEMLKVAEEEARKQGIELSPLGGT